MTSKATPTEEKWIDHHDLRLSLLVNCNLGSYYNKGNKFVTTRGKLKCLEVGKRPTENEFRRSVKDEKQPQRFPMPLASARSVLRSCPKSPRRQLRDKLGGFGTLAYRCVLSIIGGHRWGIPLIRRSFFAHYHCLIGNRKMWPLAAPHENHLYWETLNTRRLGIGCGRKCLTLSWRITSLRVCFSCSNLSSLLRIPRSLSCRISSFRACFSRSAV